MSDTSGVDPVQAMDPAALITKLPIMETVLSSVFDQAQKPEVDAATGKEKKPPIGSTVDDLVKLGKNLSSQMEGVVGTALGIQKQADQNSQDQIAAIKDAGIQDQTVQDIKSAQEMKTQKDNAAFAGSIGLDPSQSSYTLLQEGESLRQSRLNMEEMGKEYRESTGISPFEDPIGFLKGAIVGPFKKKGFQAALETYQAQVAAMREAQALTGDVAIRNAALDQVTTTAGAAALDKKIADDTAIKASQSKMDALKFDMSAINPVLQATSEQFHAALSVNSAIAQQQALTMESQRLDMAKDSADIQKLQKSYMIEEYKDKQEYANHMDAAIQKYNITYGANINGYQGYKNLAPKEKEAVDRLLPSADAYGTAGFTPAQAIENLQNKDTPRAINVGLDYTTQLVDNEINKGRAQQLPGNISWKQATPEMRQWWDNKHAIDYQDSSLKAIPDEGNMYSLPSLSKVIALPQIAGSDLAASLQPHAVADPRYATKAQDVVASGISLIAKGKSPDAVASQIVNLYSAGALLNNSAFQYRTLAMKVLDPNQASTAYTGYKKLVNGYGVVDMTNKEEVKNMLVRQTLKAKMQSMTHLGIPGGLGGGPGAELAGGNQ